MLSLEELAGRWTLPEREEAPSLPAVASSRGAVQAALEVTGFGHAHLIGPSGPLEVSPYDRDCDSDLAGSEYAVTLLEDL